MISLVLVAAVLSAGPSSGVQLRAFTADGKKLIYAGNDGGDMDMRCLVAVLDLRTAAQKVFATECAEEGKTSLTGLSAELDAWLRANKTVPVVRARTSPDKKATLEVELGEQAVSGSWTNGVWQAGGSQAWSFVVTRDGKRTVLTTTGGGDSITAVWSPDGARAVWMISHASRAMRDPGFDELLVTSDGTPSVGLALPKEKLDAAAKLADAVEPAGVRVVTAYVSRAKREQTIVFAAKGFETEAKALAAAVPGGATVAPLDWPAGTDLVVAAGPAALGAK